MKVLMINGSPHKDGNTAFCLEEMKKTFEAEAIEVDVVNIGTANIRGCIACGTCRKKGACAFEDLVNETAPKLVEADGVVVATPVYYASANGSLISFLDRLFYSCSCDKTMKVGASVAVARRGGLTATFDELNKYFTISGMPVASGYYWNGVHGGAKGDVLEDGEGMQMMRYLAKNMTFLMKSIALGRERFGLPEREPRIFTNFVR